jgi:hypothetical protein
MFPVLNSNTVLVLRRYSVQISNKLPSALAEVRSGFPHSL